MGHGSRSTVLITVAGAALPASAGGPTSVLLSAPPKVVAFGYEDTLYNQLLKLVGEPVPTAGSPSAVRLNPDS